MAGRIEENKKKRNKDQENPTNPTGDTKKRTNEVDFDEKTIKDQQNKK